MILFILQFKVSLLSIHYLLTEALLLDILLFFYLELLTILFFAFIIEKNISRCTTIGQTRASPTIDSIYILSFLYVYSNIGHLFIYDSYMVHGYGELQ